MINHNKLRRTGATLTAMLALGALSAKAVKAETLPDSAHVPEAAAQIDRKLDEHNLTDPAAINAEAYAAFKQIHERWGGLVVVHAPKVKGASVGFYTSPHSSVLTEYNKFGGQGEIDYGDHDEIITCYEPGLVRFKGRVYLVEYSSTTSQYGYLDLEHAIKAGAITTYTLNGKKQKPLKYDPMKVGIMPELTHLGGGYSEKMLRGAEYVLPVVKDPSGNPLFLEAKYSKDMPHL